jgi:hypothetical protein
MSAATMYMTLLRQRSGGVSVSVVSDPTVNVDPVIDAVPDVTPAVWSSGATDTERWEMAASDAGPWSTVSDMPARTSPYTAQTFGKVLRFVESQGGVEAVSEATGPVGAQVDFSALSDGALPSYFTGATWAVASGVAKNTPTGTSKLNNGGFETAGAGGADVFANWAESKAGTSTVNRDTVDMRTGSACLRLDIDASNSLANAGAKSVELRHEDQTNSSKVIAPGTSYTRLTLSSLYRVAAGFNIHFRQSVATSASLYVDDVETTAYNSNVVMTCADLNEADAIVKGDWTIVSGTLAGLVMNVDDPDNPQNYVAVVMAAGNTAYLVKCVNGTPSQVALLQFPPYAAGGTMELRKSGSTYKFFYNGVQYGVDQTVSDASIVSNTIHGLVSTFSENVCDFFTLAAA